VSIEKSTAIGAKLFNDFLRSDWALRNSLSGDGIVGWLAVRADDRFSIGVDFRYLLRLKNLHGVVGFQILHHTLRNQNQRSNDAKRQQYPQATTDEVNPEITDSFLLAPGNASDQRDGKRD